MGVEASVGEGDGDSAGVDVGNDGVSAATGIESRSAEVCTYSAATQPSRPSSVRTRSQFSSSFRTSISSFVPFSNRLILS